MRYANVRTRFFERAGPWIRSCALTRPAPRVLTRGRCRQQTPHVAGPRVDYRECPPSSAQSSFARSSISSRARAVTYELSARGGALVACFRLALPQLELRYGAVQLRLGRGVLVRGRRGRLGRRGRGRVASRGARARPAAASLRRRGGGRRQRGRARPRREPRAEPAEAPRRARGGAAEPPRERARTRRAPRRARSPPPEAPRSTSPRCAGAARPPRATGAPRRRRARLRAAASAAEAVAFAARRSARRRRPRGASPRGPSRWRGRTRASSPRARA